MKPGDLVRINFRDPTWKGDSSLIDKAGLIMGVVGPLADRSEVFEVLVEGELRKLHQSYLEPLDEAMKPGDLVTIRDRLRYTGVDSIDGSFFNVPGGAIGIYMGIGTGADIYDLVFTDGRLVKCARKVWSILNEAW